MFKTSTKEAVSRPKKKKKKKKRKEKKKKVIVRVLGTIALQID
jgi:hypothetical protein